MFHSRKSDQHPADHRSTIGCDTALLLDHQMTSMASRLFTGREILQFAAALSRNVVSRGKTIGYYPYSRAVLHSRAYIRGRCCNPSYLVHAVPEV